MTMVLDVPSEISFNLFLPNLMVGNLVDLDLIEPL